MLYPLSYPNPILSLSYPILILSYPILSYLPTWLFILLYIPFFSFANPFINLFLRILVNLSVFFGSMLYVMIFYDMSYRNDPGAAFATMSVTSFFEASGVRTLGSGLSVT